MLLDDMAGATHEQVPSFDVDMRVQIGLAVISVNRGHYYGLAGVGRYFAARPELALRSSRSNAIAYRSM